MDVNRKKPTSSKILMSQRSQGGHQKRDGDELKNKTLDKKKNEQGIRPDIKDTRPRIRSRSFPNSIRSSTSSTVGETRRAMSTVTSRIRERESEFTRQVQERDSQISLLKERLKNLSKKLRETKNISYNKTLTNKRQEQEQEGLELENIIKIVSKERLQLERHLALANDSLLRNNGEDLGRLLVLESSTSRLESQLNSLNALQKEYKCVEIEVRNKDKACEELMNNLKVQSDLVSNLEIQLGRVLERNSELQAVNCTLERKVEELSEVTEEFSELKTIYSQVEYERRSAESTVKNLCGKVRNLESVLEGFRSFKDVNKIEKSLEVLSDFEIKDSNPCFSSSSPPPLYIHDILAKLEADNKFLEELEEQRATSQKSLSPRNEFSSSSSSSALTSDSGFVSVNAFESTSSPSIRPSSLPSSSSSILIDKVESNSSDNLSNSISNKNNNSNNKNNTRIEIGIIEDSKSETDVYRGKVNIPGRGWTSVFIARYSYDPFFHSPNHFPETELRVNAGDYILVTGDVDEDGFFDGELLDGRRGLVPSNFTEKLESEEDLLEFRRQVNLSNSSDSVCTSIPQDLDFLSSDENLNDTDYTGTRLPKLQSVSFTDIEENEEYEEHILRAPSELKVIPSGNNSLLVTWTLPKNSTGIRCYQVLVNGELSSTIQASESPKALLPHLSLYNTHRISVVSHSFSGSASPEPCCSLLWGQNVSPKPLYLFASKTTNTSSRISWTPSNSNFSHVVFVNKLRVETLDPGVWFYKLSGLSPSSKYSIKVRAKIPSKENQESIYYKNYDNDDYDDDNDDDEYSAFIVISTLSTRLIPEPPLDVRVEPLNETRTFRISWLPYTLFPSGYKREATVTGYVILGDGVVIKDVNDGSLDQVTLEIDSSIKYITVKTKCLNSVSKESESVSVPVSSSSSSKLLSKQKSRDMIISYNNPSFIEMDSDVGPSELSDIAEEEEEDEKENEKENEKDVDEISSPFKKFLSHDKVYFHNSLNTWSQNILNLKANSSLSSSSSKNDFSKSCNSDIKPSNHFYQKQNKRSIVRIFVALFDYDPSTMSPNSDGSEEELPFREGQLIKIFGEKDDDGFYWGETHEYPNGGYVPCNMVSEVQVQDERVAEEIFNEGKLKGYERKGDREGDIYEDSAPKTKLALYDYDPLKYSPNVDAEDELSFFTGDILLVYGDMDSDGFYVGEFNGKRGLVPSNFLTDLPSSFIHSGL